MSERKASSKKPEVSSSSDDYKEEGSKREKDLKKSAKKEQYLKVDKKEKRKSKIDLAALLSPRQETTSDSGLPSLEGYKKRRFTLKDGQLSYFHKKKVRGTLVVADTVCSVSRANNCRFELDSGREVYHLRAKTPEVRTQWVKAIADTKKTLAVPAINAADEQEDLKNMIKEKQASKMESLQMTLNLAKSIEQVIASQLELLRTAEANATDADSESKKRKKKEKNDGPISSNASTLPQSQAADATALVQHAAEFRKVASRFMEAAEGTMKDISETYDAMAKELEKERGKNEKLRDRVRDLRSKNGSLRSQLRIPTTDDAAASGDDYGGHILHIADEGDTLDLDGPIEIDSDSSDDSDEYFDPLEFSDAESNESSSDASLDDGQIDALPSDANSSPRMHRPYQVERRASLIASQLPRRKSLDMQVSRRSSIPPVPSTNNYDATFALIPSGYKMRDALPRDKDFKVKISLIKILKDAIGKDLSRITVPVVFSEPVNLLQRLAEDFEYCDILTHAATIKDSLLRMAYISGFAVSGYSSTIDRTTKPFNPILGETYEWVNSEKGFRLITEQVVHHPQVSACHLEHKDWTVWGSIWVKNKFWGKSLEIFPTGSVNITFPAYGDHFIFNKVTTCMNNVLVGTKWIDHYGEMTIVNQATNEKCILDFKKRGWFDANAFEVHGGVYDATNTLRYRIQGRWDQGVVAFPIIGDGEEGDAIPVWKRNTLPAHAAKQYYFTKFAMQLNELNDWMKPYLPRTDSRFRPDQRAMENGDVDLAGEEKVRLEEKQRAARKELEKANQTYSPAWFHKDEHGNWVYNGGYWEARLGKKWPANIPDIF